MSRRPRRKRLFAGRAELIIDRASPTTSPKHARQQQHDEQRRRQAELVRSTAKALAALGMGRSGAFAGERPKKKPAKPGEGPFMDKEALQERLRRLKKRVRTLRDERDEYKRAVELLDQNITQQEAILREAAPDHLTALALNASPSQEKTGGGGEDPTIATVYASSDDDDDGVRGGASPLVEHQKRVLDLETDVAELQRARQTLQATLKRARAAGPRDEAVALGERLLTLERELAQLKESRLADAEAKQHVLEDLRRREDATRRQVMDVWKARRRKGADIERKSTQLAVVDAKVDVLRRLVDAAKQQHRR